MSTTAKIIIILLLLLGAGVALYFILKRKGTGTLGDLEDTGYYTPDTGTTTDTTTTTEAQAIPRQLGLSVIIEGQQKTYSLPVNPRTLKTESVWDRIAVTGGLYSVDISVTDIKLMGREIQCNFDIFGVTSGCHNMMTLRFPATPEGKPISGAALIARILFAEIRVAYTVNMYVEF